MKIHTTSMFSVDDIPNNKRISNAIEVTITDVSISDNSKIDYELTVEDSVGNTVAMNIWTTHEVDVSWTEAHRYELTDARGKVWTKNGQRHARLSSTKNLQVTDLGPVTEDETRIFVIGDTHVGYANRKRKNRVPQHRGVDCEDSFRKAVERATSRDVHAFVHAGDIFDDETGPGELVAVTVGIGKLDEAGIPFYYILGNHESEGGTTLLNQLDSSHRLSTEPTTVDSAEINLFGIDYHNPSDFPTDPITVGETSNDVNILIAHQTFAPLRQEGVDLEELLKNSPVNFDAILSGHLHFAEKHTVSGIPVVYTGATERISKIGTPNDPSAWLLTVSGNRISIGRQSLH